MADEPIIPPETPLDPTASLQQQIVALQALLDVASAEVDRLHALLRFFTGRDDYEV